MPFTGGPVVYSLADNGGDYMGDPGLHSKFIEMQQDDAMAVDRPEVIIPVLVRSLLMDRSRLLRQIELATSPNHIRLLRRGLSHIEGQLRECQ